MIYLFMTINIYIYTYTHIYIYVSFIMYMYISVKSNESPIESPLLTLVDHKKNPANLIMFKHISSIHYILLKSPFSYVFLWFTYGFPMVFLWFSYGFSNGGPVEPRRLRLFLAPSRATLGFQRASLETRDATTSSRPARSDVQQEKWDHP